MAASNKTTVQEYMDAFTITDRPRILACLTEDVIWEMPGLIAVYFMGLNLVVNQ